VRRVDLDALALGTVEELKNDTWGEPFVLKDRQYAINVENMSAGEAHARSLPETRRPADCAEIVNSLTVNQLISLGCLEFIDAFVFKAVQVLCLPSETSAVVTACEDFVARFGNQFYTLVFATDFSECRIRAVIRLFDFNVAKAALIRVLVALCLFASHANVVG
jgi:hypothetical protein